MEPLSVERVRDDLITMKEVLGEDSPFVKELIGLQFYLGIPFFIMTALYFLLPTLDLTIAVSLLAGILGGCLIWAYFRFKPFHIEIDRRKRTFNKTFFKLVLPLEIIVFAWLAYQGVETNILKGLGLIFAGIALMVHTGLDKKRLSYHGVAAILIVFGLMYPFYSGITKLHFYCMLLCGTFWVSAAILTIQHRKHPFPNAERSESST